MLELLSALIVQFLILGIPAYIIYYKLYKKQSPLHNKSLTAYNVLTDDETFYLQNVLRNLADYFKSNTDYIILFYKHRLLYQYTNFFIKEKGEITTESGKTIDVKTEFSRLEDEYGDELFHLANMNMNYLSFSKEFTELKYFTSHGFINFCKWFRESGIFKAMLDEMYKIVIETKGSGITLFRLHEIYNIFNDICVYSEEYRAKYNPSAILDIINGVHHMSSESSTDSTNSRVSSDDDTTATKLPNQLEDIKQLLNELLDETNIQSSQSTPKLQNSIFEEFDKLLKNEKTEFLVNGC